MMSNHDPYVGAFSQGQPAGAPPQRPPGGSAQQQQPAVRPPAGQNQSQQARPPAPAGQPAFTGYYPPPQPAQGGYYNPDRRNAPPHPDAAGTQLVPVPGGGGSTYGAVVLDKTDVKRMQMPAEAGWRGYLYNLTRINFGPGKDERYELGLKECAQRTVRTLFPVAVLNLKGGVGKTVTTEVLGSTLAAVRGGRVIAVDLDNDSGNLAERHGRENQLSIIDMVDDGSVTRYLDVRSHTSQNKSRLEVLSQPNFSRSPRGVEVEDFQRTLALLQEHYSIVLLDCGTALRSELMASVLQASRALVVVTNASIDSLRETDETLEWLRFNGHTNLLDSVLLIINHTEVGKPNVVVSKVVEQFSRKIPIGRIFTLPFDRHIHEGREITLKLLSKQSRRRYLEIGAALTDLFPRTAAD
jgi:MinD-like ATPase involved in chromosome partitioning or flagellar assembly